MELLVLLFLFFHGAIVIADNVRPFMANAMSKP
jgi:hypothetical protein